MGFPRRAHREDDAAAVNDIEDRHGFARFAFGIDGAPPRLTIKSSTLTTSSKGIATAGRVSVAEAKGEPTVYGMDFISNSRRVSPGIEARTVVLAAGSMVAGRSAVVVAVAVSGSVFMRKLEVNQSGSGCGEEALC